MQPTYDILGIGAALVDILVQCRDDFLLTHGFEKGRMHLIDAARAAALQAEATLLQTDGATLVSGGSAANTCLGVASFGGRSGFIGGVAGDALGRIFASDLTRAGVRFTDISAQASGLGTGFCICFITPDGERTMATYLGASGSFNPAAAIDTQAGATRLLYIEGYIWDMAARVAVADRAIHAAKAAGGCVALSLSDAWCAEAYRQHFLHYCREGLVDILFANEAEVIALTGKADFNHAIVAGSELAPIGVFTCGKDGARITNDRDVWAIPATRVDKVVDTTGAGDLFAAGFLYGYLSGFDLKRSGTLGARAAAAVIGQVGARPQIALATLKEMTR